MQTQDAKRVLSISVAILLLFHGIHKVIYGVDSFIKILQLYNIPSPEYFVYALFIGEIIAPILLLCNKFVNIAGVLILIHFSFYIFFFEIEHLLEITKNGALSVETSLLYLIIGATLALWKNEIKLN